MIVENYNSYLYSEVYKILTYYPTGEIRTIKSIGYCHSGYVPKEDESLASISTSKRDSFKEGWMNLIPFIE